MGSQRFCLRWNNHQSNLLSVFDQLLHDEAFVDVTLAVEGQFLKAHKMVLSACSPYFQALFVGHPDKHPIVILKDVPFTDMRSLLDFMYRGEVSVDQDRLTAFLKVAESLRIKGLTEVNEERCDLPTIANSLLNQALPPPPPPNLHRIQQGPPSGLQSPHHMPAMNKRPHHFAPNPMLNSALTAPKRKRGRPRKLSGGSPGTPGMNCDMDGEEPKINNVENHLGGGVIGEHLVVKPVAPPSLPKQLTVLNANPPPTMCSPHGDRTLCSPHQDMSPATVPDMRGDTSEPQSPVDESLKAEDRDDDDGTEAEGDVDEPSPDTEHETDDYNHVKNEEDPRPGTSGQENMSPYQQQHAHQQQPPHQNSAPDGEPHYPPSDVKDEPNDDGSDDESQNSDMTAGDYEDMIACSPGSSDDEDCADEVFEEKNGGKNVGKGGGGNKPSLPEAEKLDDDITQIEQDSFTTLMQQTPRSQSSSVRTRRLDKMSIRRYCTREGNHMYRCNVCSKTYTHISNFCRHFLSAHCGYKQDIHCPVCFKAFTRKDNMMTHAKQVHGVSVAKGPATEMVEHRSEFT
uniref:Protein tramtrack, beta isoform n=1 Tax=Lygus hesperus TaxID=30085 RepID=A0A0A9YB96_LYGHE